MAKAKDRPAPTIIEPKHPNMPRFYEWESESEPGRKHRVTVFHGEVKGCTCRGAHHDCWHKKEARSIESMIQEENERRMSEESRAVAVRSRDNLPAQTEQLPAKPRERYYSGEALLPSQATYSMMWQLAQTAGNAGPGILPDNIKTPEAAMLVMLAGYELGFPPIASLRQVFIVNGRTQLMTEGLTALLRRRDPSIDIEWHEMSATGAEATLHRAGQRDLRIRYDETDRARAHQGEKMAWDQANNRPLRRDGVPVYYKIDDSPWWKYPADMFRWAVLKRLARFGAGDLTNFAVALPGDTDEGYVFEPRNELSEAIVRGEISAAVASDAAEAPDLDTDPDTPPPAEPEPAQDVADALKESLSIDPDEPEPVQDSAAAEKTPEIERAGQDGPVWESWSADDLNAQRKSLYEMLVKAKKSMASSDYGPLARGIGQDFLGDPKNLDVNALSAEHTYEAINRVVVAQGGDVAMHWGMADAR